MNRSAGIRHALRVAATIVLGCGLLPLAHGQPLSVEAVDDAIVFNARIDGASAAQFLRLLHNPHIKRLVITSYGGLVAPALDMGLAIHRRGLDVEVPVACQSSCANYIFPAGRRKTLGSIGAVAWHGNMAHILYLQQTGNAGDGQLANAAALAAREAEFYRRIGVDGFVSWFGKIAPYNVDESYTLAVEDMARFGIRDVTVRDPGALPPDGGEVRQLKVDWAALEAGRPRVPLVP